MASARVFDMTPLEGSLYHPQHPYMCEGTGAQTKPAAVVASCELVSRNVQYLVTTTSMAVMNYCCWGHNMAQGDYSVGMRPGQSDAERGMDSHINTAAGRSMTVLAC